MITAAALPGIASAFPDEPEIVVGTANLLTMRRANCNIFAKVQRHFNKDSF
jgi:hypothetical protein